MLKVWIISASAKGFIQMALSDRFNSIGGEPVSLPADLTALQNETDIPDSVVLFADDAILEKPEVLTYVRDLVLKEGLSIFMLGEKVAMIRIMSCIDKSLIKGLFLHPVDVKEVVKTVDAYVALCGPRINRP